MSSPPAVPASAVGRPTAADFLARHRGGGLFTETVSQRIGAQISVLAHRRGIPPTALTLANLVLGLGAAALVMFLHRPATALPVGLAALLLWHLAYALDCADGQLARVTGQTSPAGARVDVLCDVALQIALVAAVSTVAGRYDPVPPALIAAFAGTWLVNLITSILQQGAAAASLVSSGSPVVRLVKLIRDYGAVVTVVALTLTFIPEWTVWLMVAFTALNGLFLLVSIAAAARASLRRP
jgi:phosphatidylglycerophosphate synthase